MVTDHNSPYHPVNQAFYKQYLQSLLNPQPAGSNRTYFESKAYNAFVIGVTKPDIDRLLAVKALCEELEKKDRSKLISLLSSVLNEDHNLLEILNLDEDSLFRSKGAENYPRIYADMLETYKGLFESFRVYGVIPFHYILSILADKSLPDDELMHIGASVKYQEVKSRTDKIVGVVLSDLVANLDNGLRNAGDGHDSWEVLDDLRIKLSFYDPKTGKPTSRQAEILTKDELYQRIQGIRRNIWSLNMGVMVYVNNNPQVLKDLNLKAEYKKEEIKSNLMEILSHYWMELEAISINDTKDSLTLGIKYSPQTITEGEQVFLGDKVAYDVVNIPQEVSYVDMIRMIIHTFDAMSNQKANNIELTIKGAKGEKIGQLAYHAQKIDAIRAAEYKVLEKPDKGEVPEGKFEIIIRQNFPYGSRAIVEQLLKEPKDGSDKH